MGRRLGVSAYVWVLVTLFFFVAGCTSYVWIPDQNPACSRCHGTGIFTCTMCNGSGRARCSACNGSGIITCYGCAGSGRNPYNQQLTCAGCGGRGRFACANCSGSGQAACFGCGGSGQMKCGFKVEEEEYRKDPSRYEQHYPQNSVSGGATASDFPSGSSSVSQAPTQSTPSNTSGVGTALQGFAEEISEVLINQPAIQEKLIRESLRFVQFRFTGYSLPFEKTVLGVNLHGVVSCRDFKLQRIQRFRGQTTHHIDITLTLDIHAAKGVHLKTLATVPLSLEAEVVFQRIPGPSGSRKITLVRLACPTLPEAREIQFKNHPDGDAGLGAGAADLAYEAFSAFSPDYLQSGFAYFWEAGRGSALISHMNRRDGQPYSPADVDTDTEVREQLGACDSFYANHYLFKPFDLPVVGGKSLYRYYFAAGVYPFVGIDTNAIANLKNTFSGESGGAVRRSVHVRLRIGFPSDHGSVSVGMVGQDGAALMGWQTLSPQSGPLEKDFDLVPGMYMLGIINNANRLTELSGPPSIRVEAKEIP